MVASPSNWASAANSSSASLTVERVLLLGTRQHDAPDRAVAKEPDARHVGEPREARARGRARRRNVEHHPQQRGREDLALRVGLERERAAAVERAVQQEVQRVEVRQLEALDVARRSRREVLRRRARA